MRELRNQIGGPAGITLKGWAYLFPWSIWLTLGFAPTRVGDVPYDWFIIGIIAHVNTGIVLLIGKFLFLQNLQRPRFLVTILIYLVAAVARGATTGYLWFSFGAVANPDYALRIGINLIVLPLWFGLVAVIVNAGMQHKNRVAELLAQRSELRIAIAGYNQQISHYRSQVIELVQSAIHNALAPINQAKDASKLLISASEKVIRPLSHKLSLAQLQLNLETPATMNPKEAITTPNQILTNMRTTAAFPIGFLPYLFMLTALPSFVAVSGIPITALSFFIIAVSVIGGFSFADKVTVAIRQKYLVLGWLVVIAVWLLVALVVGIGIHQLVSEFPKLSSAGYSAVSLIFVGTVLSSLLKATSLEWQRVEREIQAGLVAREWEAKRAQALLNAEQENLSALIHSGIQGVLVAAALKLQLHEDQTSALPEFVQQIEETCQQLLINEGSVFPIKESLESIAAVWQGVAEIELDIAEAIYDACSMNAALTTALLTLIRESLSNAVRHGRANQIKVSGEITAEEVVITVKDNGRLKKSHNNSGYGAKLYNKLSTSWQLTKTGDRLTTLKLHIPLKPTQLAESNFNSAS